MRPQARQTPSTHADRPSHLASLPATSPDTDATPGVVVHLNALDEATQRAVLTNVTNLRAGLGESTHIVVIVHGPGVQLLQRDAPTQPAIRALLDEGVSFAACGNSLRSLDLAAEALENSVSVVPSGVVRLVELQQHGWAYLRP